MSRSRPPDDDASSWGDFPETVLHFDSSPPTSVDLRNAVDAAVRERLRAIGLERAFGVITAQDPMGVTQPHDVNERRTAQLRKEMCELEVVFLEVDACSPDHAHCESSLAVEMELTSLIGVARRHAQLAIFWFDGDAFWIMPACSSNAAMRLPAAG